MAPPGGASSGMVVLTAKGLREQCARISSTPDLLRLVLTVCEGVGDVEVDPESNTIRVLPLKNSSNQPPTPPRTLSRRKNRGPDPADLLKHIKEVCDELTFEVVPENPANSAQSEESSRHSTRAALDGDGSLGGGGIAGIQSRRDIAVSYSEKKVVLPALEDLASRGADEAMAEQQQSAASRMNVRSLPLRGGTPDEETLTVLQVEGMMCQKNCGARVKRALDAVPGVSRSEGSFADKQAKVWGARLAATNLVDAVKAVGFDASVPADMELDVDGMMCQTNCGTTVRNALERVPGVTRAEVSFAEKRAWVWGARLHADAVVDAVEAVGFDASVPPNVVLEIEGMMCQKNCGTTVRTALEHVQGVSRADVSFAHKRAQVWTDRGATAASLVDAVEEVGFGASVAPDFELGVDGMMCQKNCGATVRAALENVPGVLRADVSFVDKRAKVWVTGTRRAARMTADDLSEAVESVGFGACPVDPTSPLHSGSSQRLKTTDSAAGGRQTLATAVDDNGSDHTNGAGASKRKVNGVRKGNGHREGGDTPDGKPGGFRAVRVTAPATAKGRWQETAGQMSTGTFSIEGMSCAACVGNVERFVGGLAGVGEVRVALLAGQAEVRYDEKIVSPEDVAKGVTGLGYKCHHTRTVGPKDGRGGGSGASLSTLEVEVTGMSCTSCSGKVERAVLALPGVAACSVSVTTGRARVSFSPPPLSSSVRAEEGEATRKSVSGARDVVRAIEALGFGASAMDLGGDALSGVKRLQEMSRRDVSMWRNYFFIAAMCTVPLLLAHWMQVMMMYDGPAMMGGVTACDFFMFVLATLVQLIVGTRFYRAAWMGIKHGSLGMDALVVMGTTSAYVFSVSVLLVKCVFNPLFPQKCTFETAAMLLTLVSMGKYMEAIAKGQTSTSLTALVKLQPRTALLLPRTSNASAKGAEVSEIDAALVQVGDRLLVKPGALLPADGVVVSGDSTVDESMITGESMPVRKSKGDFVFGSTVNQLGSVVMEARGVGKDTALNGVVRLVQEAQSSKAPIQAFADRVSGIFAPCVLLLAFFSFVGWYIVLSRKPRPAWLGAELATPVPDSIAADAFLYALLTAVAVTVVACPCALGLATPTAVMVGTGVGAKNGVLIKGGAAFEAAHKVNTVLLDKTGTLTMNKPTLTDIVAQGASNGKESVLALAAAAEAASEHPVGRAITEAARARGMAKRMPVVDGFQATPGMGISCTLVKTEKGGEGRPRGGDQAVILVGTRAWLQRHKVMIPPELEGKAASLEWQGKTVVFVSKEGSAVGALAVADRARPEAREAVGELHKMGISVWILTGDNQATAEAVAATVGIGRGKVMASVLPADKARKVRELQRKGQSVAMVGDGVNDSPALATADVGIAVGAGTQVAVEAADMVLVRSDLRDVVVALNLSRVVFRRIKMNFFFSLSYNVVALPLAAGLLKPSLGMSPSPALAALFMAFSSTLVVLSSLGLKLYTRPGEPTAFQTMVHRWRSRFGPAPRVSRFSPDAAWKGMKRNRSQRSWFGKSFWLELGPFRWTEKRSWGYGFEGGGGRGGRVKRGLGEESPLLERGEYAV